MVRPFSASKLGLNILAKFLAVIQEQSSSAREVLRPSALNGLKRDDMFKPQIRYGMRGHVQVANGTVPGFARNIHRRASCATVVPNALCRHDATQGKPDHNARQWTL